jgi:hypothetical protein
MFYSYRTQHLAQCMSLDTLHQYDNFPDVYEPNWRPNNIHRPSFPVREELSFYLQLAVQINLIF